MSGSSRQAIRPVLANGKAASNAFGMISGDGNGSQVLKPD
tara:strand:- start:163 stop:282 length:120 start_codon:yes stop_codon:yes gene_type:complete